jgi:ribonuclease VapC
VIEPVTETQARMAREPIAISARADIPPRLNFGDCFAYALAKACSREMTSPARP